MNNRRTNVGALERMTGTLQSRRAKKRQIKEAP